MLKIIYPKDQWILQKIGLILTQGLKNIPNDAIYYINWKYWKILGLKKSNFDIVLFTHFEKSDSVEILDASDLIVCMSDHGKSELIDKGVENEKIKVCPYWGTSAKFKKKIIIGTSGINTCPWRKNRAEAERLQKDLDSDIFEFIHVKSTDDQFWKTIDYFFQPSIIEGGSMDILNAIYTRTPVISRNIGFISSFITYNDFIYDNYVELLHYFHSIEVGIKQKDRFSKDFTWDNFIRWHYDLFKNLKC